MSGNNGDTGLICEFVDFLRRGGKTGDWNVQGLKEVEPNFISGSEEVPGVTEGSALQEVRQG